MTIINLGDYKKRDIARLIGMSVDEMNAELQTDEGMEWVFGRIVQAFEARHGAAEEAAAIMAKLLRAARKASGTIIGVN